MSADSLDSLYTGHLQTVMSRTDRSLAATGFEALVIQAGGPPTLFLDDQDYPYKVNPHFKAWVPIVDNPLSLLIYQPGSRPRVSVSYTHLDVYKRQAYTHATVRLTHEEF